MIIFKKKLFITSLSLLLQYSTITPTNFETKHIASVANQVNENDNKAVENKSADKKHTLSAYCLKIAKAAIIAVPLTLLVLYATRPRLNSMWDEPSGYFSIKLKHLERSLFPYKLWLLFYPHENYRDWS
jgi:hypothetical protein